MPVYEYRCQSCNGKVSVYFRSFSDTKTPSCNRCGSTQLTRLISKVTVIKSWGESLNFPGTEALDGVDESDPAQMEQWMRRMKQEMGDPEPSLSELDMLDAGIDPHGRRDQGLDDDLDDGLDDE